MTDSTILATEPEDTITTAQLAARLELAFNAFRADEEKDEPREFMERTKYWARAGLLVPDHMRPHGGSGRHRRYKGCELAVAGVLMSLSWLQMNVPHQSAIADLVRGSVPDLPLNHTLPGNPEQAFELMQATGEIDLLKTTREGIRFNAEVAIRWSFRHGMPCWIALKRVSSFGYGFFAGIDGIGQEGGLFDHPLNLDAFDTSGLVIKTGAIARRLYRTGQA